MGCDMLRCCVALRCVVLRFIVLNSYFSISEFCDIDGVKYKIGQRFVDRNCTGYCKCFGPTAVGCVSLCPPRFYGPCKHGETQVETVRTVLDSHCTCPVSKCVKGKHCRGNKNKRYLLFPKDNYFKRFS